MERRVVITGMSAITPIGHGKDQIVQSLLNGTSGIKPLREEEFLSSFIHSKVYGTVDYPVEYDFKRNHRKTMGPVAYYACQVAREVLEQSGLTEDFITSGRLGVAFGSIHGSPTIQRNIYKIFFSDFLKSRSRKSARSII
jgi:3-oxoacyl-[acyl-carrier-protein] synthase II